MNKVNDMADIIDEAFDINEIHFQKSLKNINRTHEAYSGFCLSCGDEISEDRAPARYCDSFCRVDHEKELGIYKGK